MTEYKLGEIEQRFANLIWDSEPLSSGALVKLAESQLAWKKSTTYTILRKLCERGIFQNENGAVTSLVSKEAFKTGQSEQFVAETFSGSLPKFLTSFAMGKKLSVKEVAEIMEFIDAHKEV